MTRKTHKLKYLPEYDFVVIGITSDERDYKLIWEINNALGWNLERQENYRWYNKSTETEFEFSLFTYTDPDSYIHYKLISNKHDGFTLLEELKNIDYLLLIYDESGMKQFTALKEKIRKINVVRAIFHIDISRYKSKERLLLN